MKNMHVVAPWTLLPGVAALLPADDSYYEVSHFLQSRQPNVGKVSQFMPVQYSPIICSLTTSLLSY